MTISYTDGGKSKEHDLFTGGLKVRDSFLALCYALVFSFGVLCCHCVVCSLRSMAPPVSLRRGSTVTTTSSERCAAIVAFDPVPILPHPASSRSLVFRAVQALSEARLFVERAPDRLHDLTNLQLPESAV